MSSGEAPSAAMLTVFSERRSDLVITAREDRADGVISLTLADPGGAQLPAWTPGAHIDLLLDDTVRQYSLCGPSGDQHLWRIAVLLDPGGRGGSVKVHQMLKVGDQLPSGVRATTFRCMPRRAISSSPEVSVSRRSCR